MRAATIATVLFATAVAALPSKPKEDVWVNNFTVRRTSGPNPSIQSVSFNIQTPTEFYCEAQNPTLPSAVTQCSDGSTYFFQLVSAQGDGAEFGLEFLRRFRDGSSLSGAGAVPTTCRKGPSGPFDNVCTQSTPVGIFIK